MVHTQANQPKAFCEHRAELPAGNAVDYVDGDAAARPDVHCSALSRWIGSRLPPNTERIVSLDGKTACGSKDGDAPGQHLVAAYVPEARTVLAQIHVDAKTNEHKAALQLLGILPLANTVFVGDAMFCQRDLCATIVEGGVATTYSLSKTTSQV